MELSYEIREDGSLANVAFTGLDGCERVTSVKQALNMLKVRNPATGFVDVVRAGRFDYMLDKEYEKSLRAIKCISMLWRCEGDEPADKSTRQEMNVLMLLANAIEMIIRQNEQLCGGPDCEGPE